MSDSLRPCGLWPTRLLHPWDFSSKGTLNGFPFPSPGDLPDIGMELGSPTLQADALPSEPPGKHQPFTRIGNIWVDPDLSFPLPFFSLISWHQPEIPLTLPLWYFSFTSFLSGWLAPSFPPALAHCHGFIRSLPTSGLSASF